ncbi:MAG: glycosyltransferase [Clostridia bacterium]|nr:glycosyltransferase [Clostridia bacterium]
MKYSIIIPVYNAEKYLDECITGIVNQRGDYELILVDDGSRDTSGKMCDKYAEKYSCIKVLHIENSGAGNARNVGVEQAAGEFLIFSDADDYLCGNFFEKLDASDVDFSAEVIFFDMVKVFPDGRLEGMNNGITRDKIKGKSKVEVYEHLATCNKFPASCCGKIINRDFYKRHNMKLDGNLVGEDIDWTLELILHAEKYDLFEDGIYYYRKTANTRSSHGKKRSVEDQLIITEKWASSSRAEKYKEYFECFLAYQYAMIYPAYGALAREERREFLPRMKKLIYLIETGKTRKIKLIKLLVDIMGIDLAAVALYNYVSLRDWRGNK